MHFSKNMGTLQREVTDLFRFPASRSPSTVELMVPSAPSTSVSQVLDSSHSAPPRCFLLARGLSPRVTCKSSSSSVTSPTYSSSESAMSVGKSGERKREDPSGRPKMGPSFRRSSVGEYPPYLLFQRVEKRDLFQTKLFWNSPDDSRRRLSWNPPDVGKKIHSCWRSSSSPPSSHCPPYPSSSFSHTTQTFSFTFSSTPASTAYTRCYIRSEFPSH